MSDRLTAAQQQQLARAFDTFRDAYNEASLQLATPGQDKEDQERAHYEAMECGLAAVLFPPANGRHLDRDDDQPVTEDELLNGYGVSLDERIRRASVPHALRRDLGMGGR